MSTMHQTGFAACCAVLLASLAYVGRCLY